MIKQKQLFRHQPPKSYGDCHRTALACLLEVPVEDVPHFGSIFFDDSSAFHEAFDEWLGYRHKLRQFHVVYPGELTIQQVYDSVEHVNPGSIFMFAGVSKNNVVHTVIAGNKQLLWDPSLDDSGIVGPIDGLYWVTLLVPLVHFPGKMEAHKKGPQHETDH